MHTLSEDIRKLAFFILISLGSAASWGQTVGASVTGTVHDPTGASLPGAEITVINVETGAQRVLISDDGGRYAAPSLPVGLYEIKAAKQGFSSQVKTGIQLVVGESAVIDIGLPVGEVHQEVNVVEVAPLVNLSTQETSGLVNERQVKELPLNGRSYDQLLTLNPATVNYTSERSGGIGTSNSAVGNMFAVSGHRPQENLFLLNGIEYTGASLVNVTPGGASGQLLGVDAVREFNVVADTYGAEYGKRPGAQVSIITASGPINCMEARMSFCATTPWTPATSSIRAGRHNFSGTYSAELSAGPSARTSFFFLGIMKDSASTLR